MRRRRGGGALVLLLAALSLWPWAGAAANGAGDRGSGASRISGRDSAHEYWDIAARLDSGHRVFARFLITNEGPGELSAAAFGHVVAPDGRRTFFDNAKRRGGWELTDAGRRIRIASSILDQRSAVRKFEYDSDRRGVKIHLWFEPDQALSRPDDPALGPYSVDLIDAAVPTRGTLWLKGMPEPLDVTGTLALTHTWTERREADVALRRIEFFSLQDDATLYLSDVTTPKGQRSRWLVVRRGGEVVYRSEDFELELAAGRGDDYPLPDALRLRSPGLEGEIRVGEVLVRHNPMDALPRAFRWLLSFNNRPLRMWTESPYRLRLKAGPDRPDDLVWEGSGFTSVTYANPLPARLSGRTPSGGA